MSENPLTPTQTTENHDDFDEILAMQANLAARRINEEPSAIEETVDPAESPSKPANRVGKAILGATITAGLAAGGGAVVSEALSAPEPSEEKTTYTVQPGDGLYDVVEGIPGVEDPRDAIDSIAGDPANIDALKDGLQPGETITVPVEFNK